MPTRCDMKEKNFLFFDIECCDSKKICEFGYVLTDCKFNIIKKDIMLINPEAEFYLIGRNCGRDLHLFYEADNYKAYKSSENFTFFYDEIRDVISRENQLIFGYANSNDAKFLKTACARYGKNQIDYEFFDIRELYEIIGACGKTPTLSKLCNMVGLDIFHLAPHKSSDDSEMTMLLAKSLCEKQEKTIEEIIELYPACKNKIADGEMEFSKKKQKSKQKCNSNKIKGEKYASFIRFLDNVKQSDKIWSKYSGKTMSISKNYEEAHYKEMLFIVQQMKNRGITYILKSSEADVFVSFESAKTCTRQSYVQESKDSGADIEIITFEKLLKILATTQEQLNKLKMPSNNLSVQNMGNLFWHRRNASKNEFSKSSSLNVSISDLITNKGSL